MGGGSVWYGDGSRLDILRAAGAAKASLIVVAIDNKEAATKIVELVKEEFPLVPVLVRAFDREHALELAELNVDYQIRETLMSSFELGREALLRLGETPEDADELIKDMQSRDAERFALECVSGLQAGATMLIGNKDIKSHP